MKPLSFFHLLRTGLVLSLGGGLIGLLPAGGHAAAPPPKPVILDTDIGDDIDDTWALGLLLQSPEFDVRLVVGDQGKNLYRAKLIAKFLERAGRTDIPVGMGLDVNVTGDGRQAAWVKDYNLNRYPGRVYPDGVQAMIDLIMSSPEPVTVIGIGPLPNVAEALRRQPAIAQKARFVGMHGSVYRGYGNKPKPDAEYNVHADVPACRAVLSAAWPVTITPLDTCGLVFLTGEDYARVRDARNPICRAIMENYRIWLGSKHQDQAERQSSTLFDTVAVYLGFSEELLEMKTLPLRVNDKGFTVVEPGAKKISAAIRWRDLRAFDRFLADRLTKPRP
jgi:inosine-uridine nucleoside N-ribohydrolase